MTLNLLHVWQTGGPELGRQITTLIGISSDTREQRHLDRACFSMSRNARARDTKLDRDVALKMG